MDPGPFLQSDPLAVAMEGEAFRLKKDESRVHEERTSAD